MSSIAASRVSTLLNHLTPTPSTESFTLRVVSPRPTAFTKKPVRVVVTGAAGNIAYSILFMIGAGEMLGADQPIELRLLDIPPMAGAIKGVIMELQDCAYPVLTTIVGTTDYKTAFLEVDFALLIGAKPRGPGMQRKDLLTANGAIFAGQGKALNQFASRNVKVAVVGNPANTNALIAATNAPDLPKSAFTAMTRLDQNRSITQISQKLNGVPVTDIKNIIIWGNHSKTQVPDINHATVGGKSVRSLVKDDKWLDGEFVSVVQDRGAAIIAARQKSSAASAASACVDHVRDWVRGTAPGEFVSMAVYSDGKSYGVPAGLIYSFPVTTKNGKWEIVQGLKIDDRTKGLLEITTKELQEEKKDALSQ